MKYLTKNQNELWEVAQALEGGIETEQWKALRRPQKLERGGTLNLESGRLSASDGDFPDADQNMTNRAQLVPLLCLFNWVFLTAISPHGGLHENNSNSPFSPPLLRN